MIALDDTTRRQLLISAKNRVGKWHDAQADPTADRGALLAAVDIFFTELQARDDHIDCRTVLLGDAQAPKFAATSPRLRIIACRQGLAVAALGPDWAHGWRRVIANDYAEYICLGSLIMSGSTSIAVSSPGH